MALYLGLLFVRRPVLGKMGEKPAVFRPAYFQTEGANEIFLYASKKW